ncbi:MAG: family 16 glycosylhydrolase [Asticcacaulis sp.]
MKVLQSKASVIAMAVCLLFAAGCAQAAQAVESNANSDAISDYPMSDPTNTGGWVLNKTVSDEFNGTEIDRSKWLVQGDEGNYYIWKGRAPSQFAAHNVLVENGLLKLRSQWEPDFKFAKEAYAGGTYGDPIAPVTASGVVSKQRFLNGYMEVRTKASRSAMTSSFWLIGYQSELDIYEQMGAPKKQGNIKNNTYLSTVHDWRPGHFEAQTGQNSTFTNSYAMTSSVADDFHVFGCEWDADYLKLYLDGKLIRSVSRAEIGKSWVLTNPMEIWFDTEIFKWLGYPDKAELPADYQVDYVRVWQKPSSNLLDRAFFGFEGPILFQQNARPLTLVPENSENNSYQKFWWMDANAAKYLSITEDKFDGGIKSLKFTSTGPLEKPQIAAFAPNGSVMLPVGDFTLSMNVWIEPGAAVKQVHVILENPWLELKPFDLTRVERGKWVRISQTFSHKKASESNDRLRLRVDQADVPTGASTFYMDDVSITPKGK